MSGRMARSRRPGRIRGEEPRSRLHTPRGRDSLPDKEQREEAKAPQRQRHREEAGSQAGQPCVRGGRLVGGGHGLVDDGKRRSLAAD
jgi:hypothetical protein